MQHRNCLYFLAHQTDHAMMSFIVETEDGKIIVLDGGMPGDAPHLLAALRRVTGSDCPAVDAWFLTHPHLDHTGALIELVSARPAAVQVRRVYYNFPSRQFLQRNDPTIGSGHIDLFYPVRPLLIDVQETVTQGDSYQIGAARIDVLYSHDPAFTADAYNDASLVLRLTLSGQTVLFLADLGAEGGRKLLAMYGDRLQSDIVQMAHHGQNGAEKDVYAAIAPKVCLWCTPQWLWDNDIGGGFNTHGWKTVEVRGWMRDLGVKQDLVAKDGDFALPLPYPVNAPPAQAQVQLNWQEVQR